jgi:cytochrome c
MALLSTGLGRIGLGAAVAVAAAVALAGGCNEQVRPQRAPTAAAGDPDIGRDLIVSYGCGACHRIPGVKGADGLVGPPLDAMGRRSFIAGELANSPENMVRWITDPQAVEPGVAMPNLGLTPDEARQIAAYLAGLG